MGAGNEGMVVKRLGKRFFPWLVALGLIMNTAGCFFNLSKEQDFKSWYFGEPGMAGALGEKRCDPYADRIQGDRHPFYLHFRTFEILYQPQGGTRFPERSTAVSPDDQGDRVAYACEIVDEGSETFNFNAIDAGLVDVIIPYRKATATPAEEVHRHETGSYPREVAYNAGIAAVMKAPVYLVHDVLKTLYIPVAGTYFMFKSDEDDETVAPAGARSTPSTATDRDAVAAAEPAAESMTAIEEAGAAEPVPMRPASAAPTAEDLSDESAAETTTMDRQGVQNALESEPSEPLASASEPTVEAVDATLQELPAAVVDGDDRSGEVAESDFLSENEEPPVPADIEPPSAPVTPDPASVTAPPVDKVDPPENVARASAGLPEDARTAAAGTAEDKTPPGLEPASGPTAEDAVIIHEEDLREGPADQETTPAAAPGKDMAPLPEEEVPIMAATRDGEAPAADRSGKVVPEEKTAASEPIEKEASPGIASVAGSQEASTAAPPVQLEEIKLSKRKLTKQAAILGFIGRAATVDPATKSLFEEKLWSAFMEECSRSVRMLRQGEPQFPEGLARLSRDQFGRLNSFELTTLARFAGINAVVTGSVIDIRLSNEIRGILWYKEPEGSLRVVILVEVYDAETGTKLLDKTLVHQAEVEELAPGSEGNLRDVDMPFLREALDAIAADMGEMVCDVLDEQPWRAYITRVDGPRLTLSAGSDTGLVPGNILSVYNSQIIDGLNNQQFFLTGERVGRLQIIAVYPDRAEANLIEGVDVQDYSLVLPER